MTSCRYQERLSDACGNPLSCVRGCSRATLECFADALLAANDAGDAAALGRAHQGRGKALRELGDLEGSASARELAAQVYGSLGDVMNAAIMCFLAGNCLACTPAAREQAVRLDSARAIADEHEIDQVSEGTREMLDSLGASAP